MIIAPDVFEIENDTYTPNVAVDWVAHNGDATVLHVGRTLRYSTTDGWEVGPQTTGAKPVWKGIDKAAKAIKRAFDAAEVPTDPAEGYYELTGPGLGANEDTEGGFAIVRHGEEAMAEQPPRTSLYALASWIADHDIPGILWRWDDPDTGETHFAAVRGALLP